MALREDQIVRYGRQILLRELGGRGQERLLGASVRVRGSGPAIDDAVAWLLAGGTPLVLPRDFTAGGFLTGAGPEVLNPDGTARTSPLVDLMSWGEPSSSSAQVVVGEGVAFRTGQACDACWKQTLAQLAPGPGPAGTGALAALTVQRLVLGWSAPLGLIRWQGTRFEAAAISSCPHASNPQ